MLESVCAMRVERRHRVDHRATLGGESSPRAVANARATRYDLTPTPVNIIMKLIKPTTAQVGSSPRCCSRCFDDRSLKAFIGRYGTLGQTCDFCASVNVRTVGVHAIADRLEPLFRGYATAEAGVHYIPAIEEPDGEHLDYLLDEDNPGLFADRLQPDQRQVLVQALLDVFDADEIDEGLSGARSADDYWVRPNSEIWAGAEDDWSYLTAPERWQRFVAEVSHRSHFFRLDSDIDPQQYLTSPLLKRLARRLEVGTLLYRAVLGGVRQDGTLVPHPPARLAGPEPEHVKEGARVNAAGVPVLYSAKDVATAIAEVRPWVGAPVSVATLALQRDVRLVDFRPRRRRTPPAAVEPDAEDVAPGVSREELDEILLTIGAAMARPIDPADSHVSYGATQYVAEVVRRAGFEGVMFRSAVGPGVNVVLFEKAHTTVERVELFEVKSVHYAAVLAPPAPPPHTPFGPPFDEEDFMPTLF